MFNRSCCLELLKITKPVVHYCHRVSRPRFHDCVYRMRRELAKPDQSMFVVRVPGYMHNSALSANIEIL